MLQSGVANFTALAARIKPDVEERVGNVVSLNTVVASLNRISHILETSRGSVENDKLPAGVRLSLSNHVSEIITKIDDFSQFTDLYDKLRDSRQAPFGIFLSLNTCRFYIDDSSNQKDGEPEFLTGLTENEFTKIKIDFASDLERVPNALIYEISNFLHTNDIDVHSAFFTPSGIVLVVENDNAAKLYGLLQEKLNRKNILESD